MAAYADPPLALASTALERQGNPTDLTSGVEFDDATSLLDALVDRLAKRVAEHLASATAPSRNRASTDQDEWFDSRHAAEHLGIHRDTLRKLAAERAIPSEQDGPNCKLYFRRADLDAWRRTGGRPRHLATTLQRVV